MIAVAVAVTVYTAYAAPYLAPYIPALVSLVTSVRLPFYLTLIQSGGDFEAAWREELRVIPGTIRGEAISHGTAPLRKSFKEQLRKIPAFDKAMSGRAIAGPIFDGILVAATADPYVVLQSSAHAIAVTPQSQLSSGSGTLFGYGYRGGD